MAMKDKISSNYKVTSVTLHFKDGNLPSPERWTTIMLPPQEELV